MYVGKNLSEYALPNKCGLLQKAARGFGVLAAVQHQENYPRLSLQSVFPSVFTLWLLAPQPSIYTLPERQSSQYDKIWKQGKFTNPTV